MKLNRIKQHLKIIVLSIPCYIFFNCSLIGQIPSPPTNVVATPDYFCLGSSSYLSAISQGNIIRWWTLAVGGTMLGTSASGGNFQVSPTVTTFYYAESYNNYPSTSRVGVEIMVYMPSTAPTNASATPSNICTGQVSQLTSSGAILGTSGEYIWIESACNSYNVISYNANVSVSPTSTTTYYVQAYSPSCPKTACISVTITVNTYSTAATLITANPAAFCPGGGTDSCTLSLSGGNCGVGANWYWYTAICGGTVSGTGTSATQTISGTTTFYVRAEGPCNTTTCTSKTVAVVTILPPDSVTANPPEICYGQQVGLRATANGNTISWWDSPSGGNLICTSSSDSMIYIAPSTTTIYAQSDSVLNFIYTGAVQTWHVPTGITQLRVEAVGAEGGMPDTLSSCGICHFCFDKGGMGGRVITTLECNTRSNTLSCYWR